MLHRKWALALRRFNSDIRADIDRTLTAKSCKEPGCVSFIPHFAEYAIGGFYQKMLHRHVENLTAIA